MRITNRFTNELIFEAKASSIKELVEKALSKGTSLEGANLYTVNLEGADLEGANLVEANLWGANLWGANLRGANLEGANLGGASLREAKGLTKQMIARVRQISEYTLSTITYVKYYPNTSLFRKLYPEARIVNNMIEV